MPAEFESGFVVRTPAWHNLAAVLDEPLTAEEALVAAHQDWRVDKAPLYAQIPGPPSYTLVPRFYSTYRDDTGAPLGIVGKDWTPVQNADAFRFLDELVGGGELLYESCGVLKGGQKVYMLARHPENMVVAGDEIKRYLLVWNGHAGTLSFGVKRVNERVVCSNTLGVAMHENGATFRTRHTSGVEFRTAEARDTLQMAFSHDERFERMANELLDVKLDPAEQARFVGHLIPYRASTEPDSRAAQNVDQARSAVLAILRNTPNLENVKDTAWGALQAATEYADWHTRVQGDGRASAESRFVRNWMKDDAIKVRALSILAPAYIPARMRVRV